jgi:hypothetical protein
MYIDFHCPLDSQLKRERYIISADIFGGNDQDLRGLGVEYAMPVLECPIVMRQTQPSQLIASSYH